MIGWTRVLREAHIPFGVVTNANLDQLKNYRAVLLPNVLEMTAEQADAIPQICGSGRSALRQRSIVARPV